ncbi:MAG: hypothetical protein C5B47_06660 [Verrucomicrobia bacterium]|nr:MAG: hypothetical protein C5B47_06660 [Verrucomicrobiota bacterium]
MDIDAHTPIAIVSYVLKQLERLHTTSLSKLFSYFADDYSQCADGHELNYQEFVQHIHALQKTTTCLVVNIVAISGENNDVLTHHRVTATQLNGTQSEIEFFAHFTVMNGKIIRCEELSRLLSGDPRDKDLGSRK